MKLLPKESRRKERPTIHVSLALYVSRRLCLFYDCEGGDDDNESGEGGFEDDDMPTGRFADEDNEDDEHPENQSEHDSEGSFDAEEFFPAKFAGALVHPETASKQNSMRCVVMNDPRTYDSNFERSNKFCTD
jgi:hypothetical protein